MRRWQAGVVCVPKNENYKVDSIILSDQAPACANPNDLAAENAAQAEHPLTDHPDHVYHFELGEPADVGEFLRALNASGPGQHHCVVFKTGGGWNRYYWCPEGEDFAEWIQRETAEQRDCGYSWAAFDTSKTAPNKGRVAANAL